MPKELVCSRMTNRQGMRYIFVSWGTLEELGEDVEALSDEYFEDHMQLVTLPDHALLVDLRSKEPTLQQVPKDYKPPEAGS